MEGFFGGFIGGVGLGFVLALFVITGAIQDDMTILKTSAQICINQKMTVEECIRAKETPTAQAKED